MKANTLRFNTTWGSLGTGAGQFDEPSGAAVGPNGNVYVVDRNNHRVQVFTSSGGFVNSWGGFGTGNGQFNEPRDVAIDAGGFVYVADFNNNRIQKFTSAGAYVTQWGGEGVENGQFKGPRGIAVDTGGFVYVTEDGLPTKRVQKFTNTGTYVTQWGTFGSGAGQFVSPRGIAVSADGFVYVSDTLNDRVEKFTTAGVLVSILGTSGSGNGQFTSPIGVACRGPLVYVVDSENHRVQIFSSNGTFLSKIGTLCNLATSQGCVDPDGGGGPLHLGDGQLNMPRGIAIDAADDAYVVDTGNNRMEKFVRPKTSDVPGEGSLLDSFGISPNPTSDAAWVRFALPTAGDGSARYGVDARVFDISGRLVRQLFAGEMEGGEHVLYWDGTAPGGGPMGAGVFFLRIGVNGSLQRSVKIVRLGH